MKTDNIWQGKLVRLRAVEPDDWEKFFEWDKDTEFARYTDSVAFPASREALKKWTAELAHTEPKNHEFRWIIENLKGEFVGTINTHTCDSRTGTFRYGIAIRREHWHKGYASDAIRLVLTYFFHELRYQKVSVNVYAFNEASLKLHQKLGFREEGRLRRMVYTHGTLYDDFILGMTVEEFDKSQKQG